MNLNVPIGSKNSFGPSPDALQLKEAQESLELVKLRFEQVGYTNPSAYGPALKDANTASNIIKAKRDYIVNTNDVKKSIEIFDKQLIPDLDRLIDSLRNKDVYSAISAQEGAAASLAHLRLLNLPTGLPFNVPDEYQSLPQLLGRASIEVTLQNEKGFRLADGKTIVREAPFVIEVDGYHAPLTAGNFVDLVNKKFYDGMRLQKIEALILQTGKPSKGDGYVDNTGNIRKIPL